LSTQTVRRGSVDVGAGHARPIHSRSQNALARAFRCHRNPGTACPADGASQN